MARSLSNLANSIAEGTHELNVNMNIIINIIKGLENTKIVSAVLNTQTLKMIHWNTNACVPIRITKKSLINT